MEIIKIRLTDLEQNKGQVAGLPSNPRQWGRGELDNLVKSIQETPELLEARGLIVWPYEGKYIILGGNMRFSALREMNAVDAPCYVLPEGTPMEKLREIVIKDNGSFGSWDFDMLANEWDDLPLNDWGVAIPDDYVGEGGAGAEPEVIEDNFNEDEDVEPRCKQGDIWLLGDHRLMCGDSTKGEDVAKLMSGEEADMVFTDPPYGVSYVGVNNPNGKEWKMIANDDLRGDSLYAFLLAAFANINRFMKKGGAFYVWFASSNHIEFEMALKEAGLRVKQELIWDKGMVLGHSDYHWAYEPCLYGTHIDHNCTWYGDRTQKTFLAMNRTDIREMKKEQLIEMLLNMHEGRSCWKIDRDNVCSYIHPTQKPLGLAGRGIKNSSCAGQIVLDLFGGSGSTLMAAEQLGRKARLMEYDPVYCDKIIARWETFTGLRAEKVAGL